MGESSPPEWATRKDKPEENFDIHALSITQTASSDDDSHLGLTPVFRHDEFRIECGFEVASVVEHQFISTTFSYESPLNDDHHQEERERQSQENLSALRNESEEEDISVSLQLGESECKRRKVDCDSS